MIWLALISIVIVVGLLVYAVYWVMRTIENARKDTDEAWKIAFAERDARAKSDSDLIALQARLPPPPVEPPPLPDVTPTPVPKRRRTKA